MSAYNDRETLSTLRFGNRAKAIKNKPIANAQRSAKELLVELEKVNSYVGELEQVIKIVQNYLNTYFETDSPDQKLIFDLKKVASAKDVKLIYSLLKGEMHADLEDEGEYKDDITDATEDTANNSIPKSTTKFEAEPNNSEELKQEIAKYEEEIESASKEIAQLNEKVIIMQVAHNQERQNDLFLIRELQETIDKFNRSTKTSTDLYRFRNEFERLRSDLEVLKVSDKFTKRKHTKSNSVSFKNNEVMLGDNLNEKSLDNSNSNSNSSLNISNDKLILDNIQRAIGVITDILNDLENQDMKVLQNLNKINDTENTTIIMQDILNGAVGENVVASQEESFLNSYCSDINVSKFDENTVKFSVSASILEEKENTIKELKQLIDTQNKNIISLTQANEDLKDENSQIKAYMHDIVEKQAAETTKDDTNINNDSEVEKLLDKITKLESDHKAELERSQKSFNDVKKAKDKIYEEVIFLRNKIDEQEAYLNKFISGMPMNPMNPMNNMMGSYIIPTHVNGHLEFNTYNNLQSDELHSRLDFNNSAQRKDVPKSFFTKKMNVVKPIKGGGKKVVHHVGPPNANPYESSSNMNKEFESITLKHLKQSGKAEGLNFDFHKPPPTTHFAPLARPNSQNESNFKPKTIKDFRKESKKNNYLASLKQAKKMVLDESVQNIDESINLDKDDSDDNDNGDILDKIDHMTPSKKMGLATMKPQGLSLPLASSAQPEVASMVSPSNDAFKPKKKGFISALFKYMSK